MSPVGGVGINYAVQDAVAAANVLQEPLRRGMAPVEVLALVQKEREWPTRVMQYIQGLMLKMLVKRGLDSSKPFKPPFFLRWPLFRRLPPLMVCYGARTTRLKLV
jgi:2-polyprenyl-6-methoxyphenol hydroxylase-like FAD-dependent oxidoreductase